VRVTGHTGVQGSWLCLWLRSLGAQAHGVASWLDATVSGYEAYRDGADMRAVCLRQIEAFEGVVTA
jgi:CDP-glucose 4,6-dehydratase